MNNEDGSDKFEGVIDEDPASEMQRIQQRIKWLETAPVYINGVLFEPKKVAAKAGVKHYQTAEWKKYLGEQSKRAAEINRLKLLLHKNKAYLEGQMELVHEISSVDLEFARKVCVAKINKLLHGDVRRPKKITNEMTDAFSAGEYKTLIQTMKLIVDMQCQIRGLISQVNKEEREDKPDTSKAKSTLEDILGMTPGKKSGVKKTDAFAVLTNIGDKKNN